jgi:hypothetical protein
MVIYSILFSKQKALSIEWVNGSCNCMIKILKYPNIVPIVTCGLTRSWSCILYYCQRHCMLYIKSDCIASNKPNHFGDVACCSKSIGSGEIDWELYVVHSNCKYITYRPWRPLSSITMRYTSRCNGFSLLKSSRVENWNVNYQVVCRNAVLDD